MLEVDEGVLPSCAEARDGLCPFLEIIGRVALIAQPEVAEVGGCDDRRGALLAVNNAKGGVPAPEQRVYIVVEPRLVTKLEGRSGAGRYEGQDPSEPVQVLAEVRRNLEQDRAEL